MKRALKNSVKIASKINQRDSLADPKAIQNLIEQLRSSLPELIPSESKGIKKILLAARHLECYPASGSKRGRPAHFQRTDLLAVSAALKVLLVRETQGRVGLRTFVDHYLPLLDFPAEIIEALRAGFIRLPAAELLARITAEKLQTTARAAQQIRLELLQTHLSMQATTIQLRQRINSLLGRETAKRFPAAPQSAETLEATEVETLDPTHLFYDQLRQIGLALQEVKASELSNEALEEILTCSDQLLNALARAKRKLHARKFKF